MQRKVRIQVSGMIQFTEEVDASYPNLLIVKGQSSRYQKRKSTTCGKFAYVANYRSGTVSMIDTSSNEVVKTFDVGEFPADPNCPDEDVLYVTISSADSVTVIGVKAEIVLRRAIPVGAVPQGIAITKDGGKIYVVNSDSETISALGF